MFVKDLGIGLLLTAAVGSVSGQGPSENLLAWGLLGAVWPDIDMIVWWLKEKQPLNEWAHKHRDLLHYPLMAVPLSGLVAGAAGGWVCGIVCAATTMAHFVHDTVDNEGWGIRWFWVPWPVCAGDNHYYYISICIGRFDGRYVHRLTPLEQDVMVLRFGDPLWAHKANWALEIATFLSGIAAVYAWYHLMLI